MRSDKWLGALNATITDSWNGPTRLEMGVLSPADWQRITDLTSGKARTWLVPPEYPDEYPESDRYRVLREALDLLAELWPKPASATVTLETHTWLKLRRTLLAIPDLVADAEKQDR